MARSKKKNTDPHLAMEQLLTKAVDLFQEPYDDRFERDSSLPSLRSVADELNTTILRTRKLLITAEYFSTSTSRLVQELSVSGCTVEEIMATTGLSRTSVNSYLPYKNLAFNLDQTTVNADRHKLFRRRVKAVEELQDHMGLPDELEYLWKCVIAFEGYPFQTSGRGNRPGVRFKYTVSRNPGAGGRHYKGGEDGQADVGEFGNELWVTTHTPGEPDKKLKKSISRSTVDLAYRRAVEAEGKIKGPKALGLPGSGSYLYVLLIRFGVCKDRE